MSEGATATTPVPAEEQDSAAVRQRLWASLANRRRVTVDTGNLQRLLTFVEQPTFREVPKETQLLPQIEQNVAPLQKRASEGSISRLQTFYNDRGMSKFVRTDTNLYSPRQMSMMLGPGRSTIGGVPIDEETAVALRRRVYGSCIHSFSKDWRRNHFLFQDERGPFAYGLVTNKDGAKGLVLAVQAYVLRHMLFASYISDRYRTSYLRPNEATRRECLVRALADVLWKAGEARRQAVACLVSDREYVETSYDYRPDDITERLHLFKFKKLDEVRSFFRRNLQAFESPYQQGCILFLYAVALSRGLGQLQEDFDFDEKATLIGDSEELTQRCLNLLLTGVAGSHVHNGNILYDDDGNILDRPMFGVQERADIGLLCWERAQLEERHAGARVGSMLRTPRYPIWLTRVNGHMGLLFSTSAELCNHWRSENSFTLYYYTGLATQTKACRLSIDTRRGRSGRASRYRTRLTTREDKKKTPALEHCILSKWFGAHIDWNGTIPFV